MAAFLDRSFGLGRWLTARSAASFPDPLRPPDASQPLYSVVTALQPGARPFTADSLAAALAEALGFFIIMAAATAAFAIVHLPLAKILRSGIFATTLNHAGGLVLGSATTLAWFAVFAGLALPFTNLAPILRQAGAAVAGSWAAGPLLGLARAILRVFGPLSAGPG